MNEKYTIPDYFDGVETKKEHKGYFCSVKEALTIVILGSICGLENIKRIHQWASSARVAEFLSVHYSIRMIPCYFWLTCLMKLIKPKSLNHCFINWVNSLLPESLEGLTVSFDGKTICSTATMDAYERPLHIISAHIAQLGVTYGQLAVSDKSNEIPAVRDLIQLLNLEGCMVVADALNCQKDTAQAIIDAKADYLLNVKENHPVLKEEIEDYVQEEELRKDMDSCSTLEKNGGRIEKRTAFVTDDIQWMEQKEEWANLRCIGAIHTQFTTSKGTSDEWHYYISSKGLNAEELLAHARLEWSVESMHWLLDVHFREDSCRIEDKDVQQNMNIIRKMVLNWIKLYKQTTKDKHPMSKIMFDCLLEPSKIIDVIGNQ